MATDSLIGYAVTSLTSPPASGDSLIGFAVTSLADPEKLADSPIGFKVTTLRDPHHPQGVVTGPGVVRQVPVLAFDGASWR